MTTSFSSSFVQGRAALAELSREAQGAGLVPRQLEHDLRWLGASDHGEGVEGLAIALREDGRLSGYVPLRYRRLRLPLRLGELPVATVPYRALQLFGTGLVGEGEGLAEAALAALARVPHEFDGAMLEETPIASTLWQAIERGAAGGLLALERGRTQHRWAELPGTFREYLERFSSKTRNSLGRKTKRLDERLGPIELRTFTAPGSMRALLADVGRIAPKTYHYHLLGQDLTLENVRLLSNLELWAAQGWIRGYVLAGRGAPIAYGIGFVVGGRLFYELVGYDPAHAQLAPGIVLLTKIIEDLVVTRAAGVLDFGAGDADYKRLFGTGSREEGTMLLARRTARARTVAATERLLAGASRLGGWALYRLGLKAKVKGMIRRTTLA